MADTLYQQKVAEWGAIKADNAGIAEAVNRLHKLLECGMQYGYFVCDNVFHMEIHGRFHHGVAKTVLFDLLRLGGWPKVRDIEFEARDGEHALLANIISAELTKIYVYFE